MDKLTNDKIQKLIDSNPVMVFMKGTKLMPQCGFSNNVVQILNSLGVEFGTFDVLSEFCNTRRDKRIFRLANNSSSLFKRRISWRIRHSY